MRLPRPRGPLSTLLFPVLAGAPAPWPDGLLDVADPGADPLTDDDLQITLFVCYALHYRGFAEVDDTWEWHPSLVELCRVLEHRVEAALRRLAGPLPSVEADGLGAHLLAAGTPAPGGTGAPAPSLADHMLRHGTVDHFREFAVHRSLYNLIEADPHSWALPRVSGRAKAALVEIQADEYGGGVPGRMHSELYAEMMAALGLENEYGFYIEEVPALSMAAFNALTMFGLHRRHRGALLGNLAVSEIGSSHVNRCFSRGLQRLGADPRARWFYDEHVEADAVHEQIAAFGMCGAYVAENPAELPAVLFGARASQELKRLANQEMVRCWQRGVSSLRPAAA